MSNTSPAPDGPSEARLTQALLAMRASGLAQSTLRRYEFALRRTRLAEVCLHAAMESRARELLAGLGERGRSRATRRLYLTAMRRFLVSVGVQNPLRDVRIPAGPRVIPVLPLESDLRLLLWESKGTSLGMAVRLALGTGARLAELCDAKGRDVESERGLLHIPVGKGGSRRVTCLPRSLLPLLKAGPHQYLTSSQGRARETPQRLQRALSRAVKRAGCVGPITFRSLRHLFATEMLDRNVDLDTVRRMLGHRSILTTQRYLHLRVGAITRCPDLVAEFETKRPVPPSNVR